MHYLALMLPPLSVFSHDSVESLTHKHVHCLNVAAGKAGALVTLYWRCHDTGNSNFNTIPWKTFTVFIIFIYFLCVKHNSFQVNEAILQKNIYMYFFFKSVLICITISIHLTIKVYILLGRLIYNNASLFWYFAFIIWIRKVTNK